MGEFRVRKLLSAWTVQSGPFILSEDANAYRAIAIAVERAATAALSEKPCWVVFERSEADRQVIWDSTRDSFSKA